MFQSFSLFTESHIKAFSQLYPPFHHFFISGDMAKADEQATVTFVLHFLLTQDSVVGTATDMRFLAKFSHTLTRFDEY